MTGILSRHIALGKGAQPQPVSRTGEGEQAPPDNLMPLPSPPRDRRAASFDRAAHERAGIEALVRETLSGVVADAALLEEFAAGVGEVHRYYRGMRDGAVLVGRQLLKLRQKDPMAYSALFREVKGKRVMPFTTSIASRMCRVAALVDSGKVEQHRLPLAYSAAYEIALLAEAGLLPEAEAAGLLAPEVNRDQVLRWKAERREADAEKTRKRLSLLAEEKAKLVERLAAIEAEMVRLAPAEGNEDRDGGGEGA